MLNLHRTTRGLLAGSFLALALVVAPSAAAIPVVPEGEDPAQLSPPSGPADPAPAIHATQNGLGLDDVALAAAFGLIAFAITAVVVAMTLDRRRAAASRDRRAATSSLVERGTT
jgi:hypothetical protein